MMAFVCFLLFFQTAELSLKPENLLEVNKLRLLYKQSPTSEDAARQLRQLLERVDTDADPLMVCYQGAAEMIQAKYVFSPVSKLRSFKKGKVLIEEAIARDREGVEMRYLRFTIQTNLPWFLGYDDDIDRDKQFLMTRTGAIKDKQLKRQIIEYLSASNYCTETEKKQLKKLQEIYKRWQTGL